MLVIVTHELDAHADAVIAAMTKEGFTDFLRIDLETVGSRFHFQFNPTSGDFLVQSRDVPERQFGPADLKTIWWRRAGRVMGASGQALAPTPETLDRAESYHAMKWLIESMPESCFPFGHPNRMRAAENKFLQLRVASDLGFITPATMFTNDPAGLSGFAGTHPELVVKPLKTSYVYEPASGKSFSLYAHRCDEPRMAELMAAENTFSIYCQAHIRKIGDIRVNVFPSAAVACWIDSASIKRGTVDWRPEALELDHRIVHLPSWLEAKCREYLRKLDLKWGAFDFGVTAEGDWTFFECNPNGQWLWIETKTGFLLSSIVASSLLAHHRSGHGSGYRADVWYDDSGPWLKKFPPGGLRP